MSKRTSRLKPYYLHTIAWLGMPQLPFSCVETPDLLGRNHFAISVTQQSYGFLHADGPTFERLVEDAKPNRRDR